MGVAIVVCLFGAPPFLLEVDEMDMTLSASSTSASSSSSSSSSSSACPPADEATVRAWLAEQGFEVGDLRSEIAVGASLVKKRKR